jgi:hypothetical protein
MLSTRLRRATPPRHAIGKGNHQGKGKNKDKGSRGNRQRGKRPRSTMPTPSWTFTR